MDFQSQLLLWAVILVIAVVIGGPVLVIFGMFIAWLLPFVILGGLALVALTVFCRGIDKK